MSAPRQRTRHLWKIRDGEVPLGAQTLLLGVLDLGVDGARPEGEASLARASRSESDSACFAAATSSSLYALIRSRMVAMARALLAVPD